MSGVNWGRDSPLGHSSNPSPRDQMRRERTSSEIKWQAKVSRRREKSGLPLLHGDYTVLYLPGLEKMAIGLAEHLGDDLPVLCTEDMFSGEAKHDETGLCWERFPSGDPDIKLRVDFIKDRHIILLMNHDTVHLFEQLAVILFLQRFNVPHALDEYAKGKWKKTMVDGKYEVCSCKSLTIIVPWYRHCQMERTCRWTVAEADGKARWFNGKAAGEFVDVPTAQSFAAMLSALPIPGACAPPPQQLLLIDIHEYEDLEITLNSTNRWANDRRPYDPVHGVGTYFASAFDRFLSSVLQPMVSEPARAYVVFPDGGAHRRFYTMVHTCVPGIPYANILWIDKTRVGALISQAEGFKWVDEGGAEHSKSGGFPAGSFVLLADDFTNSGSTLFGGAAIVRKHAHEPVRVCAYVTHYVAKYDRATVSKFVARLYGSDAPLDEFHCSDSIPNVIAWLKEDVKRHVEDGKPQKAHVMQLAPLVGDWIIQNNARFMQQGESRDVRQLENENGELRRQLRAVLDERGRSSSMLVLDSPPPPPALSTPPSLSSPDARAGAGGWQPVQKRLLVALAASVAIGFALGSRRAP